MLQMVWSWQPALYLFLGGMGAGAFIMAAVLYLIDQAKHVRIIGVSMWAAVVCLAVGLLLLVSELTAPIRGMMMWQSFSHFTSWMTIGAWGLFAAVVVFGLSAVLATPLFRVALGHVLKKEHWKAEGLRKVLAVAGILLGAFVAIYTGVLLMTAPGVPLWNTPLLPCLFTVSAFDTGIALVELVALAFSRKEKLAGNAKKLMELAVVVLVVSELVVLAVFLGSLLGADTADSWSAAAAQSSAMLTSGVLAPYFWIMVVACGLVLPLVMAIAGLVLHRKAASPFGSTWRHASTAMMAIGAVGALIGGCELRFLILAAGTHADLMSTTIMSLIS